MNKKNRNKSLEEALKKNLKKRKVFQKKIKKKQIYASFVRQMDKKNGS